jgi:hypothetical protein
MPNEEKHPASLDLHATVYYKNAVPGIAGYKDGLLITARAVCSCSRLPITRVDEYEKGLSIVYEKSLDASKARTSRDRAASSITDANQLQALIHHEMIQSLSSADRYPRGMVSLLDTQLVSSVLASSLPSDTPQGKQRLEDWPGVDRQLASRVAHYDPTITRAALLAMPLAHQVEQFGLTYEESVALRRSIADMAPPTGPIPVKRRPMSRVPLLTGLDLRGARIALDRAGLRLGAATTVDSTLPAASVVTQHPAAGDEVYAHTEIAVEIASGQSVRLPDVNGFGLIEAGCLLRSAGMRSEPLVKGQPGPHACVVAIDPPAGTLVTPLTPITIQLEHKPDRKRPHGG